MQCVYTVLLRTFNFLFFLRANPRTGSLLSTRSIEALINRSTNVRGKALTMIAVCSPLKPPLPIKIRADAARNNPQLILTKLGGLRLPPVVCIPSTNVAESADVIKNVPIKNKAMADKTPLHGI